MGTKKKTTVEAVNAPAPEITTEILLKSPRFARYQPDFLKALLPKTKYTIDEAGRIVTAFFDDKRR